MYCNGSRACSDASIQLTGDDLTVAELVRLARSPAIPVRASAAALARVRSARSRLEIAVSRYSVAHNRDEDAAQLATRHVYGVTTGFGAFKHAAISPLDLLQLQTNLVRSHAVGVGCTADADDPCNYLPAEVVRAALAIRINSFLKGLSGVRPQLVRVLLELLEAGVIPLAPTHGSLGASGDLCPLAHIALVLMGEGRFYLAQTPEEARRGARGATLYDGLMLPDVCPELATVLAALESADSSWPTYPLSYKEGLALINGSTVSAAMLALAVHDAQALATTADISAALTLEAMRGQRGALDARVHAARGHSGQTAVAAHMRALTAGSAWVGSAAGEVQDAYSLRCVPQVHGASRDALGYARDVAERELNAATDNPLVFACGESGPPDTHGEASGAIDVVSGGNFHGQPVALASDFAAIAVAELGSIAERRVQMLLDRHHNRGLPANLTTAPGLQSGLMVAQYTAASLVSENKGLCHPASVDSIPTSSNTEDHNSMSMTAARKLRMVVTNVEAVLALELLTASQAVDLLAELYGSDRPCDCGVTDDTTSPTTVSHLGVGTRAAYRTVREVSPRLTTDRSLEPDLRAIRRQIAAGELLLRVADALSASVYADAPAPRSKPTVGHVSADTALHCEAPTPPPGAEP